MVSFLRSRTHWLWLVTFLFVTGIAFIGVQQRVFAASLTVDAISKNSATACTTACNSALVTGAPSITTQPQSQTIAAGTTADLSVVATGAGLSYQWYQGTRGITTNPIGGATNSTFTTPPLTTLTRYWVRVTNSVGHVDSNTAIITVPAPPAITNQPQDQSIYKNQTADLAVVATGDTLAYQWYQGTRGITTNPIGGATSSTFTTPALTATTNFWVRVSNLSGNEDSHTVKVTVLPPPVITTHPQSQTIFTGNTADLSVVATGSDLSYQWYKGTRLDTTNPIIGANSAGFTTPPLTARTRFWVLVSNPSGTDASNTAIIDVQPAPPKITTQPQSQSIFKGQSADLSVVAVGDNLTYQWYQGTSGVTINPIGGATSSTFTTPTLTANNRYWVQVSNENGSTNSMTAVITILPAPGITTQPQSQTIFSGQTADLSVVASGQGLTYQWYQGSSGNTANPIGGATNSTFTTPALTTNTNYWVRVTNPSGHVDSNAALITVVAAPPVITTEPQSQTIANGGTANLSVGASGENLTYQWYQGSSGDTSTPIGGATSSTFTTPALTTTTNYWVRVTNPVGHADSNTAVITVNAAAPLINTEPQSQTIASGSTADLSVGASGENLTYQWYQGSSGDTTTPIGGATNSTFTTPVLTATTNYWVRVSNSSGNADSNTAVITVTVAGAIIVSPIDGLVTTEAGGTATFTVVLNSQPTADVSIDLSSSNTNEGTVSPTSLTFTSANWNVAQTVTVTGVNDSVIDGDIAYTIVTAPAVSDDPNYKGIDPDDVSVTNKDNDSATVIIAPTSLAMNENSAPSQYRIQLLSAPASTVTIALGFDPAKLIVDGSSTSPVLLNFTNTTAQAVTVAVVKDPNDNTDRTTQITHTITPGSSPEYLGRLLPNVTVGIADVPPPPPTPLCSDENFDEHGVVRTGVPNTLQYAINCRVLYQNGGPTTWLGNALYNSGSIGIEGVLNLGVEQAIDIFSPAGMNYFQGGAVFCLRGEGTLIWMAASHSPRIAEIIGSYTVPDFPGFTCATLFEPGTLVLVSHTPAQ